MSFQLTTINRNDFENHNWHYYLYLEKEFSVSLDYVAYNIQNYDSFSDNFAKQLLTICMEIENVFKLMFGGSNIIDYTRGLVNNFPNINNTKVKFLYNEYLFQPLSDISYSKDPTTGNESICSPYWWKNYNKLKHDRTKNFKHGNLINVRNSLASLYILNLLCLNSYRDSEGYSREPLDRSMIFTTEDIEFTKKLAGYNLYIAYEKNND